MPTCPKGHSSTAEDYCDECGAPIGAVPAPGSPAVATSAADQTCPQCGAVRTGRFCEADGYDFVAADLRGDQPTADAADTGSAPSTDPSANEASGVGEASTAGEVPEAGTSPDAGEAHDAGEGPDASTVLDVAEAPDVAGVERPAAGDAPSAETAAHGAEHAGRATNDGRSAHAGNAEHADGASGAAADGHGAADLAGSGGGAANAGMRDSGTAGGPAPESRWRLAVRADHDYHLRVLAMNGPDAEQMEFPRFAPERQFALQDDEVLVGRSSRSRGIEPQIDLTGPPEDPGVSRSHALLVRTDDGWSVVDLDSANGTYLNGSDQPIEANSPLPLRDGDRIHVGAWTTLSITAG